MCTFQASHFNLMSLLKNLFLLHFVSGYCHPLKTFRINAPLFSSFLPFKQSPLTNPPLLCFSNHSLFLHLHYLALAPITFSLEPFSVLSTLRSPMSHWTQSYLSQPSPEQPLLSCPFALSFLSTGTSNYSPS